MQAVDQELTAVIYILYAIDCIHWLKPGQAAMTRGLFGGWSKWEHRPDGFTLLGFAPAVANPLDLRPGWFVFRARNLAAGKVSAQSIESFLNRSMPRHALVVVAIAAAINLLVLIPALLLAGLFGRYWLVPTVLAALLHGLLAILVYRQSAPWRQADCGAFWREYIALMLNPLAALRAGDMLGNGLYGAAGGKPRQATFRAKSSVESGKS